MARSRGYREGPTSTRVWAGERATEARPPPRGFVQRTKQVAAARAGCAGGLLPGSAHRLWERRGALGCLRVWRVVGDGFPVATRRPCGALGCPVGFVSAVLPPGGQQGRWQRERGTEQCSSLQTPLTPGTDVFCLNCKKTEIRVASPSPRSDMEVHELVLEKELHPPRLSVTAVTFGGPPGKPCAEASGQPTLQSSLELLFWNGRQTCRRPPHLMSLRTRLRARTLAAPNRTDDSVRRSCHLHRPVCSAALGCVVPRSSSVRQGFGVLTLPSRVNTSATHLQA